MKGPAIYYSGKLTNTLAWIQAVVYIGTGLWALVDIDSFMAVTGPKEDVWLVRTVGFLVISTGIGLVIGVIRQEITLSLVIIALSNALFLAGIDVFYATNDVIWDVYLLDALFELAVVVGWTFVLMQKPSVFQNP